jgi:hypothetical protein
MGREEACTGFLVGKPEGKRPLGIPRCRWEDNIKMDLQEVGCRGMDWIGLAQDRESWRALVNAVMNFFIFKHTPLLSNDGACLNIKLKKGGDFLTNCKPDSFSRTPLHGGSKCQHHFVTNS